MIKNKTLHLVAFLAIFLSLITVVLTLLIFFNYRAVAFEAPASPPSLSSGGLISLDNSGGVPTIILNKDLKITGNIEFTGRFQGKAGSNFSLCHNVITCAQKGTAYINYGGPCQALDDGATILYPLGVTCAEKGY